MAAPSEASPLLGWTRTPRLSWLHGAFTPTSGRKTQACLVLGDRSDRSRAETPPHLPREAADGSQTSASSGPDGTIPSLLKGLRTQKAGLRDATEHSADFMVVQWIRTHLLL